MWLVAVVQLGALLVVSVVQQLHMTELTHSNLQLKLMLLDIMKGQSDYIPSDTAMEVCVCVCVRALRIISMDKILRSINSLLLLLIWCHATMTL